MEFGEIDYGNMKFDRIDNNDVKFDDGDVMMTIWNLMELMIMI